MNGQKDVPGQRTGGENTAIQNVLNIAAGVSDECKDEKGADSNENSTTEVSDEFLKKICFHSRNLFFLNWKNYYIYSGDVPLIVNYLFRSF